jgi:hypothetical protein
MQLIQEHLYLCGVMVFFAKAVWCDQSCLGGFEERAPRGRHCLAVLISSPDISTKADVHSHPHWPLGRCGSTSCRLSIVQLARVASSHRRASQLWLLQSRREPLYMSAITNRPLNVHPARLRDMLSPRNLTVRYGAVVLRWQQAERSSVPNFLKRGP